MDRAPAPKTKPFLLAWCVCLLFMELAGAGFARMGLTFDFPSLYAAGYQVRTHPSQLYDLAQQAHVQHERTSESRFLAFYHPSYEALMYAPFSLLKYRAAYLALIAFEMLLLMAAFFAACSVFSNTDFWLQPKPGLMLLWFVPLLISVIFGQDSILFLLLSCLAWRQLESGKDMNAGCLLALCLFKFQFAVPIAILIAIRRGWRFAAGFLVTSAGVALLCIGIVGVAGMRALARLLFSATTAIDTNTIVHRGMGLPSAMPSLAGLLYACTIHLRPSPSILNAVTAIFSFLVFAWCAWVIRRFPLKIAFSIAIMCGLLVSYHLGIYDLTLLLLPVALLAGRAHRYISVALFGLPILILMMGGTGWFSLMALPLLAMLANALSSSPSTVPFTPDAAQTAPA